MSASFALHELKSQVVDVCRKIDERQYVGGRDGNVSVRVSKKTFLVTPAGVRKGDVGAADLLLIDPEGRVVQGRGAASTETEMHLRIYARRPEVGAVVHAHPPVATGFAVAGIPLDGCVLPELIVGLGRVPLAPYATPGTPELSDSLDPWIAEHDAWLLENHGVVTAGPDLASAHHRMETVEQAARILLTAEILGGARPLPEGRVRELLEARPRYGVREGLAGCTLRPRPAAADDAADEQIEKIVERVLGRLRARPE